MATSESDDFESADEEMSAQKVQTYQQPRRGRKYASIGSDSDDDIEFIPVENHSQAKKYSKHKTPAQRKRSSVDKTDVKSDAKQMDTKETPNENKTECEKKSDESNKEVKSEKSTEGNSCPENAKPDVNKRERPQRQRKPKEAQSLGTKKFGAKKIDKFPDFEATTPDEVRKKAIAEGKEPPIIEACWEECDEKNLQEELHNAAKKNEPKEKLQKKENKDEDVPDELKSNLKFKDIFKPDGWEGLSEDVVLPEDLSDDKYQPVLDKLAKSTKVEQESPNDSWGAWGSWGVSSFLNSASVGVSTLTNHVSQGLSFIEESLGVPDPTDLAVENESPVVETPEKIEPEKVEEKKDENVEEEQPQYLPSSFGFGNLISSMSSITKLVETTSTKVISGGLDTLETIGKKTMEVLQEGDPGLKKKRAFFLNEADKPILSQILREAKEKADLEEKSFEEKELARKIHFESLFDDYQGLVHLEALEMLSKQCNMKIQQQLINLDGSDLISIQETLDEVKELCDLGGEDEEEEENEKDLKARLEEAWKDLGISITYDKLIDCWIAINSEIPSVESTEATHIDIFQKAISGLAQFTAYSVERFHKTAELILIKECRSTVSEVDSLVQLTKILSSQIGCIANLFCNRLRELKEDTHKSDVNSSITTISLEATNASSYVQEAFRLLIPILQVGAI